MGSLSNILNNLDWTIVLRVVAVLLCITIHELSHGFVAYRLGDSTAKSMGRLTLNPIKHIDIIGLVMMIFVGFGWAKPVPIDMRNFKNPKSGMAISALAGPVSNIILAYIALLLRAAVYPFAGTSAVYYLADFLDMLAILSIGLALFNILPIPPLDGSKVLFAFLSDKAYYNLMRFERYGFIILIIVAYSGYVNRWLINGMSAIYGLLFDLSSFPYYLIMSLIH